MKILKINLDSEEIVAQLRAPTKIIVEMHEKGDKPIKGVDYFTSEEKNTIVHEVLNDVEIETIDDVEIDNLF